MAAFIGLSGDLNPLYADVEYARGGPFGEVVVPGALIAATAIGLGTIDGPVPATVGLVGMEWRFQRPVRVGDTIRCRWRLHRKRDVENPRWGLAVWQVEVENQRGEAVATAEVARLVSRRQVPAELRPGRKRRRRRGTEAEAAEVAPKPPPGPLREPLPEPARRSDAARDERPRPPDPAWSERSSEKVAEAASSRTPRHRERPPEPAPPALPVRPGSMTEATSGSERAPLPGAQTLEPSSEPGPPTPTPEPVPVVPSAAPAGAWRPPEEVRQREEARAREADAGEVVAQPAEGRPTFAPLAPEASWPPLASPPVTAETRPASRRRRVMAASGDDGTEATPSRRRRRRHGAAPTAPPGQPEGSIPGPEAADGTGPGDDPATLTSAPPEG